MKKKYVFCFASFFLFVCLVIPLHTTANAANTTDDCLQILASDFNSNSAQRIYRNTASEYHGFTVSDNPYILL